MLRRNAGNKIRSGGRTKFHTRRCHIKTKMKTKVLMMGAMLSGLAAICSPVFAHHGAASYDMSKPIVLKDAVVTQFLWINPHPLIKADYKDEKGNVQHWTMEMGSTPASGLIGWNRTTLRPADWVPLILGQAKQHLPLCSSHTS